MLFDFSDILLYCINRRAHMIRIKLKMIEPFINAFKARAYFSAKNSQILLASRLIKAALDNHGELINFLIYLFTYRVFYFIYVLFGEHHDFLFKSSFFKRGKSFLTVCQTASRSISK